MRDRTPTKVLDNGALRYGVYDESGNFLRHEYLALDDAPTDTGTDLSKATLLADETEVSLFGSAADRTVDDAFRGLAGQLKLIMGDMAQITVTLTDSAGTAIPGVLVQGILSDSGQAVYSDDSGVVSGYISEGSQTIKITGYADIEDYSETLTVTKGTAITKAVTLTTRNFLKITSSQMLRFSQNVSSIDVSVGGGGGGGNNKLYENYSGGGGGGGYSVIQTGVVIETRTAYSAIIGSGGSPANKGGSSSFIGITADGGNGGTSYSYTGGVGNGNGGDGGVRADSTHGDDGSPGTSYIYTSFTEQALYGGGGGGGYYGNGSTVHSGGSPSGGNGGWWVSSSTYADGTTPANNTGGGGGGAGLYRQGSSNVYNTKAGSGGSGCVAIRMHLKSAE